MQYPIFRRIKPIKSATIYNYPCKYSLIQLCILGIVTITYSIDLKVGCMNPKRFRCNTIGIRLCRLLNLLYLWHHRIFENKQGCIRYYAIDLLPILWSCNRPILRWQNRLLRPCSMVRIIHLPLGLLRFWCRTCKQGIWQNCIPYG